MARSSSPLVRRLVQSATSSQTLNAPSSSSAPSTTSPSATTATATPATTVYRHNASDVLPWTLSVHGNLSEERRNEQIYQILAVLCPFLTNNAQSQSHKGSSLHIQALEGGLSNELFVVQSTCSSSSVLLRIHPSHSSSRSISSDK